MSDFDEQVAELERLEQEATPGPWEHNSYNAIFSGPLLRELNAQEIKIPTGTPDDDPRWAALPEPLVASVPASYGDTATGRRAIDAELIAAMRNALPGLLEERKALKAENEESKAQLRRIFGTLKRLHEDGSITDDVASAVLFSLVEEPADVDVLIAHEEGDERK